VPSPSFLSSLRLVLYFRIPFAYPIYYRIFYPQDFSTDKAFKYLERYRHKYPVFNDDIQGTGAVVLSGFINAAKLSSEASGKPLEEHRILFLGAGSAGVGVGTQLMSFFTINGLTKEQARDRIYLVDSQGLVYDERGHMAEHKKCQLSIFVPY
jgi:malate dehydrogenase (oxaloacetate-decarboxylating)(NADP+)